MALYKAVTVFSASDGSTHTSSAKAAQHTRDHVCRTIDRLLKPLTDSGKLSLSERTRIVLQLAETDQAIGLLCKELAPVLNWIINNTEDLEI